MNIGSVNKIHIDGNSIGLTQKAVYSGDGISVADDLMLVPKIYVDV